MLPARKKRALLLQATEMAGQLTRGNAPVTRAELRPVLNVLFLTSGSWSDRLGRARQLLDALPESWAARRSGKTRPQLAHVRSTLRGPLTGNLDEEEARFLLGWVARLVHIHDLEEKEKSRQDHGELRPGAE